MHRAWQRVELRIMFTRGLGEAPRIGRELVPESGQIDPLTPGDEPFGSRPLEGEMPEGAAADDLVPRADTGKRRRPSAHNGPVQSCANSEFPVSAEYPRFSAVWGGCNGPFAVSAGNEDRPEADWGPLWRPKSVSRCAVKAPARDSVRSSRETPLRGPEPSP